MKENIKKAVDLAEQEIQEKEIAQLKGIIKNLLQNKVNKEEEKREIEKEISVIKQTIDDFKAGRLDKVKDLIEKDKIAKDILPFKIVIINQPVITQPWNWTYQVQPIYIGNTLTSYGGQTVLCGAGATTTGYITTTASATGAGIVSCSGFAGTTASNFTSGTYLLDGGRTINL